jgi:Lon protease-like protein
MTSDSIETEHIVPVFPLPDTVFFPHTSLPLHIFEPRYRAMVRDVTAGDGLIVVARKVGDGFEHLATVGRVRDLQPLEDGRYNLRLEGLRRVELTEIPCDTPYRQARIRPRPELPGSEEPTVIERSKLELLATLGILLSVAKQAVPVVLDQDLPFEVVVNKACAGLPVESSLRQELLAADDLVSRQKLVSHHLNDVIETVAKLGIDEPVDSSELH